MNTLFGNAATENSMVLVDQTLAATNFFSSMRLPATFFATQSINTLFKIQNPEESASTAKKVLVKTSQFLMTMAFMTSISSVVAGTGAAVVIMDGSFSPMALNTYDFLVRELEFEYLSVRLTFIISIFCFLIGMSTQSIVQFDLLQPYHRKGLAFFVSVASSVTIYLLSYFNHSIIDYGSIVGMTGSFIKKIYMRCDLTKPLVMLFAAVQLITVFIALHMIASTVSIFLNEKMTRSNENTNAARGTLKNKGISP
mmetsp:Transcript_27722/g.40956  ORF Transcript_27722/g.40956 Transcript_27722/m.40956 type:complete len:254 (-) Transcript_27722:239-1000(-)